MVKTSSRKIAVLVDADNLQSDLLDNMLNAIEKHGKPIIRRAYGDWTNETLDRWHLPTKNNSFELIQVTSYSVNKNATDIGLVIDAMDIMFQGVVDGICIISNDSDFTGLCIRLRNAGLFVMGIGGQHASPTLRNACEEWVYIHDIKPANYKKRRSSFRFGKRRQRNTSQDNTEQTQDTTPVSEQETLDDEQQSRWTMVTTSLSYIKRKMASNTQTDTTPAPVEVELPAPEPEKPSPAQSTDWQSQLERSSPLRNGQSKPMNNNAVTQQNTNNGHTKSTPLSDEQLQPVTVNPTDENNTGAVATKQVETKQSMTDNNQTTQPKKQQKSKKQRNGEIDSWKPFIEELGDAYIQNLLLSAYYIADDGSEWLPLSNISNNINQLSPRFRFKALGYKKLSDLVERYPHLMSIRQEGEKNSTKYYVKLAEPK